MVAIEILLELSEGHLVPVLILAVVFTSLLNRIVCQVNELVSQVIYRVFLA